MYTQKRRRALFFSHTHRCTYTYTHIPIHSATPFGVFHQPPLSRARTSTYSSSLSLLFSSSLFLSCPLSLFFSLSLSHSPNIYILPSQYTHNRVTGGAANTPKGWGAGTVIFSFYTPASAKADTCVYIYYII